MKTVTLGNLKLPEYVAEKPIGIRGSGELIFARDILDKKTAPSFGLMLATQENKTKLALARIEREPDFEIGILNKVGKYTKAEVIQHIKDHTSLGLFLTDIEVNYCEYFTQQLLGKIPLVEKIPPIVPDTIIDAKITKEWDWIPKQHWHFFKSRVLFCENTTDGVTSDAAAYRIANVHPVFAARGFEVISLEGANDIRANFVLKASDAKVCFISGVGHGSYTRYTGHLNTNIIQVGAYNSIEVKNKIIHLLSCETARTLGPDLVAKGAKSVIGYDENFVFDWANKTLYWACDSQFDISMANGRTVEQAIADTYAKYDAAIASVPGTSTAATLFNDRNLLRSPVSGPAWGIKTARISPLIFRYMTLADFMAR